MKFILSSLLLLLHISVGYATPLSDELIVLHHVSTTQMNNIASPTEGSLVFNTDDKEIYEYSSMVWKRISSNGSETKMNAGKCMEVVGSGTTDNPYIINYITPGKSKERAGLSCKEILDVGCPVASGMYWINPNGGSTDDAFEVFCDMETDGGGWTKVGYKSDLPHKKQFNVDSDGNRWLENNFELSLTDEQIDDIRAVSTEARQHYHGTCQGVIHYYYASGDNYKHAFGFRFHHGHETAYNQATYPDTNITVSFDECSRNDSTLRSTEFDIVDIRLPIINVHSRDNGNNNEKFGSPLTKYPAWFR
jgi:hypothetical protein